MWEAPLRPLAKGPAGLQDGAMPLVATPEAPLILMVGALPDAAAPLLREAGWRVREATGVAAAFRQATTSPAPQLLLLADSVGEQRGTELLRRLREEPATATLPVIYVGAADEELALALGASDCLNLPLRPLLLLTRVQAQLALHRLLALNDAKLGAEA
ncbi:MAG: response regulator [Variovorax sp.]|nr:MAG: response regulator [Variovorax sp.]